MKRIWKNGLIIVMCALLVIGICACGEEKPNDPETSEQSTDVSEPQASRTKIARKTKAADTPDVSDPSEQEKDTPAKTQGKDTPAAKNTTKAQTDTTKAQEQKKDIALTADHTAISVHGSVKSAKITASLATAKASDIKWSVSNEGAVSFNQSTGVVTAKDVASSTDVTITATLPNGKKDSITIHVEAVLKLTYEVANPDGKTFSVNKVYTANSVIDRTSANVQRLTATCNVEWTTSRTLGKNAEKSANATVFSFRPHQGGGVDIFEGGQDSAEKEVTVTAKSGAGQKLEIKFTWDKIM